VSTKEPLLTQHVEESLLRKIEGGEEKRGGERLRYLVAVEGILIDIRNRCVSLTCHSNQREREVKRERREGRERE